MKNYNFGEYFQEQPLKYMLSFPYLYSDPSQNDSNTKDFWMDMQAVTGYLKKLSEQNPSASYYNVDVLKYQVTLFILILGTEGEFEFMFTVCFL